MIKTIKEKLVFLEESLEFQIKTHKEKTEALLAKNKIRAQNICFGINAGHGGILPSTGKYATAPSKMFRHEGKKIHTSEGWFYEGVFNRTIANKLCKRLKEEKLFYKKFYHQEKDLSLGSLVYGINSFHQNTKKVCLLSLHSNASAKHNARGFSVWTSRGNTSSDASATKIWQLTKGIILPKYANQGFKMLTQDYKDKDPDYEKDFYIVKRTYCEAVLLECLFFDNWKDASILIQEDFQDLYVEVLVKFCIWRNEQESIK